MSSVSSSKDAPSEAEAGHYDSETNHVVDNFMSNVSGRESSVRIKEVRGAHISWFIHSDKTSQEASYTLLSSMKP